MRLHMLTLLFTLCAAVTGLHAEAVSNALVPSLDPAASTVELTPAAKLSNHRWTAVWAASVALEGAGSAFDAYTSYHNGPYESSGLLRSSDGQFGSRAVVMKAAFFAGITAGQWIVIRKWPKAAKLFAPLNAALGAAYVGSGLHNQSFLRAH